MQIMGVLCCNLVVQLFILVLGLLSADVTVGEAQPWRAGIAAALRTGEMQSPPGGTNLRFSRLE